MKKVDQKGEGLKAGQLWRLKKRYVSILALQQEAVRFKFSNTAHAPGERELTADYETLWRCLVSRHGRLV